LVLPYSFFIGCFGPEKHWRFGLCNCLKIGIRTAIKKHKAAERWQAPLPAHALRQSRGRWEATPFLIILPLTAPHAWSTIRDAVARRWYRLARTTLALFQEEDGYVARPLEKDERIEFDPDELLKGLDLVEVLWQDELVLMFAADLMSLIW
jgi:hypothetical protein